MLPRETMRLDQGPDRAADTAPVPRLPILPPFPPLPNGLSAPTPQPPRPAPAPPALTKPVSVLSLVQALRRQWVLGLSAGLAAGAVAGCVAFALLPAAKYSAYTARATLQVSANAPVVVGQPSPQVDFGTVKGTIQARVKSRVVLDEVLKKPEIKELSFFAGQPDPYEFLQNELAVDWGLGPEVLSIKLSGEKPKELATLVNAVADAALQDINTRDVRGKEYQLKQLEEIHKKYDESLGPKRKELEELAKRAGGEPGQRTLRQVFAAMALNTRQAELLKVQSERRNAEALLKVPAGSRPFDPTPKPAESKVTFEEVMKSDPELQPLMAQIADLNGQIARFTALYKDNPAKAKQVIEEKGLQSQIDALYALGRRQYENKLKALGGGAGGLRPEANSTEELKARVAFYEASEESLEKEIKKLEEDLRGLETKSTEIDSIKQEIAVRDDVSKNVATVLEKLRLEASALPRASRLEEASVPVVREERRVKFAGLTGLGGFAFALFEVAFLEFRRRKLYGIGDVAQGLEVPVVGSQPLLPAALNPLDPGHAAAGGPAPWHALPNDGLDATRALLLQAAPPTAGRAVAVVSAAGGEGASVLAVQLAAGLARAGRRTLLLDANLRRPAVHRAFGAAAAPGLSEVLRGEAPLTSAVRAAPPDRLWVLPAGAADLRSLQALSREGALAVLDQLKKDYDYVVIDAAPVVPCADALLLAQRADAVLVSVLGGVSAVPTVHAAWQRLSALGARLMGVVVQGAADDGSAKLHYEFRQAS